MKLATLLGAAWVMVLVGGAASAAQYGSSLGEPNTLFDRGVVSYDPTTGLLTIDATPRATRVTPGEPRVRVDPPSSLAIRVKVRPTSGRLIRGTFRMEGDIDDYDAGIDYSGVLLTGELEEFRWVNRPGTDLFVFRFSVTGGSLAPLYADAPIDSVVTVRQSSFTGSFETSFGGTASGYVGIPVGGFACGPSSSITSEFNGTPIPPGATVWFNSVLKVKGLTSGPVTIK